VAGYIFVILKHLKSNPNDWISLPEAALNSGKPVDYKKGAYFSAVNYKVFKMRIADHRIPSHFNVAALLIYDPDGRLVFEKNMAIVLSSDNITSKSSRKPESRKVGDQEPNHKKPGSASPSSSDLGRTNAHAHQSLEKKVPLQSASKGKKNEPIPDMAKTLTPEWPSSHPFSIHVFSYQHQQQAQHRVQELEKKGYDSFFIPVNIPNKGQFYRIFIGQYKSAQAAGITLKEIKSKPEFEKDIHIMSRQQALAK
jgi:cell division septation protein DedD